MNLASPFDMSMQHFVELTGFTLLLSAIPIGAIAIITRIVVGCMRSPTWRYNTGIAALVLFAATPIAIAIAVINLPSTFDQSIAAASGANGRNSYTNTNPGKLIIQKYATEAAQADVPGNAPGNIRSNETGAPVNPGTINRDQNISSNSLSASPGELQANDRYGFAATFTTRLQRLFAPWMPSVVSVWVIGLLGCSLRIWLGWRYARRIAQVGVRVDQALIRMLEHILNANRIRRHVAIYVSELIAVPMVVGFFKSVILVPASVMTNLSTGELESVLRHEVAHIRRYDAIVNLLQTILETILFYHPAVWWISGQVRNDRELCCDEMASLDRNQAYTLARALLRLEELRATAPMAIAATGGRLTLRISRLLQFDPSSQIKRGRTGAIALAAIASAVFVIVTCAFLSQRGFESNELNGPVTSQLDEQKQRSAAIIQQLEEDVKGLGAFSAPGKYRSAAYMNVASQLLALPENRRVEVLKDWSKRYNDQCIVLCRMLFEAKEGGQFRRPGLGAPSFVDSPDAQAWPLEPIALVDNVPFVIVHGYLLGGQPEPASNYLEYCLKNCKWRERDYSKSDQGTLTGAFKKLMDQFDDLSPTSREFLANQIALQEADEHARWQLYGKVTDAKGNPLPDVEVRVATGMGTLLGGGQAHSDKDGNYKLNFGEGIWSEGPNMQVAWVFVSEPGYVYKSNSRNIDLSMAMSRWQLNEKELSDSAFPRLKPDDLIVRDRPHKIDLVMEKPAVLLVNVYDADGNPIEDSHIEVDDTNQTSEATANVPNIENPKQYDLIMGVATDRSWTLSVPLQGRQRQRSQPLTFSQPGHYLVNVAYTKTDGATTLTIKDVKSLDGTDVTDNVVRKDPTTFPPLAKKDQEAARELVKKMAVANSLWLSSSANEEARWKGLTYEIQRDGKTETLEDLKPQQLLPTYRSGIHFLIENPDNVVFRSMKTTDEGLIEIAFSFKQSVRISIGNGILGSFRGFVQTNLNEGVLLINGETLTPVRLVGETCNESFSDFVSVGDSKYVPTQITISKPLDCDWKFTVYEDGLWMTDSIQKGEVNVKGVFKDGIELKRVKQ
jgi:beta-lactamase regulating signal transducer with metallopeptidase domain